jgi:hypothetical protein
MARANSVTEYIAGLPEWQQEVSRALRKLVLETAPEAGEAVKWSHPVFELGGPFAYIHPYKNHINFGFWRGASLPDPQGLLEGSGDKMRHVKLAGMQDLNDAAFREFIRAAVDLNRTQGDPTRNK